MKAMVLKAHLFQRGDEGVAVLWSTRVPSTILLPVSYSEAELRDLYGNPLHYQTTAKGARVRVNGAPTYLTFTWSRSG